MASSRKSSRSRLGEPDLSARVAAQLANAVKPGDRLTVGLSGGVDSIVLLDCLERVARKLRIRVSALHVNHQLSPNAGRWSAFCRRVCRARGVPFRSARVKVTRGDSIESAARAARYAAFRAEPANYIALAHHQDDQVETVFLQLLRGAGVKGLAAMPMLRDEGGGRRAEGKSGKGHPSIVRPLLDVPRSEIVAYARARGLEWIEDESNTDLYFKRNFLRQQVLPVIARRFPAYRATVARAARHLAEAAQLLDEMAASDSAGGLEGGTLAVAPLRRLPAARARNLLRYFLAGRGVAMPGAEQLGEALRQVVSAKQDARVRIDLGDAGLRRFDGRLYVVGETKPLRTGYSRRWRGERSLSLPELGGVLRMDRGRGDGISVARLKGRAVSVRVRRGGERLQPDCRRPRRSLKNLLQEARMPPWRRECLPLIFCDSELVWAAEIGVDCRYLAGRNEPSLHPIWDPLP